MEAALNIAVGLIITAVWIAGGLMALAHLASGEREPRVHSPQGRLIPTAQTDQPVLAREPKQ